LKLHSIEPLPLTRINIAEDVILVFRLNCLELAVRDAEGWSRHETTSDTALVFQKMAPDALEYKKRWNSKNWKDPSSPETPLVFT
jgi:hypothetical protein